MAVFNSINDDYLTTHQVTDRDTIELPQLDRGHHNIRQQNEHEIDYHEKFFPDNAYYEGSCKKGYTNDGMDYGNNTHGHQTKKSGDDGEYTRIKNNSQDMPYDGLSNEREAHQYGRLGPLPSYPASQGTDKGYRNSFHGCGNNNRESHVYNGLYQEANPYNMYEVLPPIRNDPPPYSPVPPARQGNGNLDNNSGEHNTTRAGSDTTVKSSSSPNMKLCLYVFCGALGAGLIILTIIGLIVGLSNKDDPNTSTAFPSTTTSTSISTSASTAYVTTSQTVPTTSTAPPSGWSEWTSWSQCTSSCGGGVQSRNRTCPIDETCHGTGSQAKSCQKQRCPGPNYGKWSTWESWSNCPMSCGGGSQVRKRECVKTDGQMECPGVDEQNRMCNDWECPVCGDDSFCPSGCTLDSNCTQCISSSSGEYTGTVTTVHNIPIQGVQISNQLLPSQVIASTDETGKFTIPNACMGIDLLLQKTGFSDQNSTLNQDMGNIILERIILIDIEQHPEDKVRLVGESATLCCIASAFPAPEYFEWFKDNVAIVGADSNTLTLNNLQKNDTGYYKCRANSKHGAVYSEESYLRVEESTNDFCSITPVPRIIELPTGCFYKDSTSFDVGKCSASQCRHEIKEDNDQSCNVEGIEYCCGPLEMDKISISCENDLTLPLLLVTQCGCIPCSTSPVLLLGRVLDEAGKPVVYAEIWINGTEKGLTDQRGEFFIQTRSIDRRIVVTVRDKYKTYYNTTKTIFITDKHQHILYRIIRMLKKGPIQKINSSIENKFNLGSFAELTVPPNSIQMLNGSLVSGEVDVQLGVIDPNIFDHMVSSPGNLLTVTQEGVASRMTSFGMFSLKLYVSQADEDIEVTLGKPVSICFDSSLLPDFYDTKRDNILWSLSRISGKWEPQGQMSKTETRFSTCDMAKKIQFTDDAILVGDITIAIDNDWYNFDLLAPDAEICYVNVHVFGDDGFENPIDQNSIEVSVIIMKEGNDTFGDLSTLQAVSDYDDPDSFDYCMATQCDYLAQDQQRYYGYILVEDSSDSITPRLHPAWANWTNSGMSKSVITYLNYEAILGENSAIRIDMNMSAIPVNEKGPLYYSDQNDISRTPCSSNNTDNNQLRFYKESLQDCFHETTLRPEVSGIERENYLAFYARSHVNSYDTCYVKIKVLNGLQEIFRATSYVGNFTKENITRHEDIYGTREQCPLADTESSICIELKHSGPISNGEPSTETDDDTLVDINHIQGNSSTKQCRLVDVASDFKTIYGHNIVEHDSEGGRFKFYKKNEPYGLTFGIYCVKGEPNIDAVQNAAFNMCAQGGNDAYYSKSDPRFVNNNNQLLTYECE